MYDVQTFYFLFTHFDVTNHSAIFYVIENYKICKLLNE